MFDRLEGAFRKLSDFSSDIAHELRTPVSNLMMQTQFALAKERDVSHYREILFANLEELKRLSRMTSDMLFLARSEHGLLRLDIRFSACAIFFSIFSRFFSLLRPNSILCSLATSALSESISQA